MRSDHQARVAQDFYRRAPTRTIFVSTNLVRNLEIQLTAQKTASGPRPPFAPNVWQFQTSPFAMTVSHEAERLCVSVRQQLPATRWRTHWISPRQEVVSPPQLSPPLGQGLATLVVLQHTPYAHFENQTADHEQCALALGLPRQTAAVRFHVDECSLDSKVFARRAGAEARRW